MLAAPVGAAQTVRARREVPKRAEQRRVVGVLRQQPVRSAVAEGQDRFSAFAIADVFHARRNQVERLVPGDPGERALTLGALPHRRIEQAILAVDPIGEPPDLAADETAGDGVLVAAVDLHDPAVLDRDVDRAGVGAIQGTGGADRRVAPALRLTHE